MSDETAASFWARASSFGEEARRQFEASARRPLADFHAPEKSGAYALYREPENQRPVYVGSTANLRNRLKTHARKIQGRQNISINEMSCRYLAVSEGQDWIAAAAVSALIKHYDPSWMGSGFGSNEPGIGRPGIHPVDWNERFPPRDR